MEFVIPTANIATIIRKCATIMNLFVISRTTIRSTMCHMVSLVTMHLNRCAGTIRYAILTQHVEQNASLTTVWHVQTIKLCVLVSISTTITITIALEHSLFVDDNKHAMIEMQVYVSMARLFVLP